MSNARVVLGGVTYAMANITSVAIAEQPANKKPGIALTVVGALIAICTLGSQSAIGGLIFGLILVGIGVLLLLISEKPQYFVRLRKTPRARQIAWYRLTATILLRLSI
ncbi:MAG: DUF6232 family protein [Kouleothrix sp.]